MNRSTLFWMIMIIVLLGYIGAFWWSPFHWGTFGGGVVVWVLMALIGWKVFGPIIKGD